MFNSGVDCIERNANRDSFKDFTKYLRGLEGNSWYDYYYSLKSSSFDNIVSLKTKHREKDFEIGHYLPDRNIVVLYFPITYGWENGLCNKYVLEVLRYIKFLSKKHKFKSVDVSKAREKIMLSKFTIEIEKKIEKQLGVISSSESYIKEYEGKISDWHRKIIFGLKEIGDMRIFSEQIKEGLTEKIKEIKKLKFVKSTELSNEGIVIKFNKIFIKVRGVDVRMGDYTITLLPNSIKIINSKPVDYGGTKYHSPHIQGGTICYGDQSSTVNKLLGEMKFKKLVHFLWLYLNSYNEGDTYLPMRDWIAGRKNKDVVPNNSDEGEEE